MAKQMETVRDVCKYIGSVICEGPVCIETGSTYTMPPGNETHTTTNNLMEFVCLYKQGVLYSLDIDAEHIEYARSVLPQGDSTHTPRVEFILGDSVSSLKILGGKWGGEGPGDSIDLLCLDSKEFDEDHMVKEFNAIKHALAEKHFVLVDDIHNPNSVKYKKMVPLLKELGYKWTEIPTPTGLFLAAKGYQV